MSFQACIYVGAHGQRISYAGIYEILTSVVIVDTKSMSSPLPVKYTSEEFASPRLAECECASLEN